MQHSHRLAIADLVSKLLSHFATADEPLSVRRGIAEDWIEDLGEFTLPQVEWACREWRRTQSLRPAIADIRRLATQAQHDELERRAIVDDARNNWPQWLAEIWGPAPDGPRKRAEWWNRRL